MFFELISYTAIYYVVAIMCVATSPSFLTGRSYSAYRDIRSIVAISIVLVYMMAMLRSDGVDMPNYIMAYNEMPDFIPDRGFQLIIRFCKLLHMPFSLFVFSIGVINIYALRRYTKSIGVGYGLFLVIWFLHIAVIRDFAQLRSSLAISMALLGIASGGKLFKYILYFVSVSIHATVIPFILAYEVCGYVVNIKNGSYRVAAMVGMIVIIMIIGKYLSFLAFLDPRMSIYLNWSEEGYGSDVASYGFVFLHSAIIIMVLFLRRFNNMDNRAKSILYMEILGVAVFFSMSSYAIFAFRLSSIITSLYPALIILSINATTIVNSKYVSSFRLRAFSIVMILFILIFRPGSKSILDRILF